jgi:HSP20 family protein
MLVSRWDPFPTFEELFETPLATMAGVAAEYPPVNVWQNEQGAVLTAELPGLETGDLEIAAHGNTLTLRGSRKNEMRKEGETYHRRERMAGEFTRTLQLPFRVDADHVQAKLSHGVLSLTLPRAAEDKPHKIAIKAA